MSVLVWRPVGRVEFFVRDIAARYGGYLAAVGLAAWFGLVAGAAYPVASALAEGFKAAVWAEAVQLAAEEPRSGWIIPNAEADALFDKLDAFKRQWVERGCAAAMLEETLISSIEKAEELERSAGSTVRVMRPECDPEHGPVMVLRHGADLPVYLRFRFKDGAWERLPPNKL